MPVVDGLHVLQEMGRHAELASVPVMMMSANATDLARLQAFQLGAMDFIPKPFTVLEVILRARRWARASQRDTERVVLRGALAELGLPSLLTMFEQERKTGQLSVTRDQLVAWIDFVEGKIVRARSTEIDGDSRAMHDERARLEARLLRAVGGHAAPGAIRARGQSVTHLLLEHARLRDEVALALRRAHCEQRGERLVDPRSTARQVHVGSALDAVRRDRRDVDLRPTRAMSVRAVTTDRGSRRAGCAAPPRRRSSGSARRRRSARCRRRPPRAARRPSCPGRPRRGCRGRRPRDRSPRARAGASPGAARRARVERRIDRRDRARRPRCGLPSCAPTERSAALTSGSACIAHSTRRDPVRRAARRRSGRGCRRRSRASASAARSPRGSGARKLPTFGSVFTSAGNSE